MDIKKIKEKAIRIGLISSEEAESYSQEDAINLIFLPGFSTSQEVTDMSGRGVGMDVVKKNIESLNGGIEVFTTPSSGTKFRIRIPLSMAIVTALKVKIQGRLLAVPISVILETIKIQENDIYEIDKFETISIRESHVSLLRLGREMGMDDIHNVKSASNSRKPVVIVQFNDTRMGLLVDELIGYEDMVIKSLSNNYEEIEGLAGVSILGRGEICLILDVQKLIENILADNYDKRQIGTEDLERVAGKSFSTDKLYSSPSRTDSSAGAATTATIAATTEKLGDEQLLILKKIIATGRKSALAAVRKLTNNPGIQIKFSTTRFQSIRKFKENLDRLYAGQETHACYVNLEGPTTGNGIVFISRNNILKLATLMYGEDSITTVNKESISAIREITNILMVSFTNAMNVISGRRILPTPPEHIPDFRGLFRKKLLLYDATADVTVLMIETEFTYEEMDSILYFYILHDRNFFVHLTSPEP